MWNLLYRFCYNFDYVQKCSLLLGNFAQIKTDLYVYLLYFPINCFISSLLWMEFLHSNTENQNGTMPQ